MKKTKSAKANRIRTSSDTILSPKKAQAESMNSESAKTTPTHFFRKAYSNVSSKLNFAAVSTKVSSMYSKSSSANDDGEEHVRQRARSRSTNLTFSSKNYLSRLSTRMKSSSDAFSYKWQSLPACNQSVLSRSRYSIPNHPLYLDVNTSVRTPFGIGKTIRNNKKRGDINIVEIQSKYPITAFFQLNEKVYKISAVVGEKVVSTFGIGTVQHYRTQTNIYEVSMGGVGRGSPMLYAQVSQVEACHVDSTISKLVGKFSNVCKSVINSTNYQGTLLRQHVKMVASAPAQIIANSSFNRKLPISHDEELKIGDAVLTIFGPGRIKEITQPKCTQSSVVYIIGLVIAGTAYLRRDSVLRHLEGIIGDRVKTKFGTGIISLYREEEQLYYVKIGTFKSKPDLELCMSPDEIQNVLNYDHKRRISKDTISTSEIAKSIKKRMSFTSKWDASKSYLNPEDDQEDEIFQIASELLEDTNNSISDDCERILKELVLSKDPELVKILAMASTEQKDINGQKDLNVDKDIFFDEMCKLAQSRIAPQEAML